MKVNTVSKIRIYDKEPLATVYFFNDREIVMPKYTLFAKNAGNAAIPVLKPRDKFIELNDKNGFDIAYVYNWHLYFVDVVCDARQVIKNMPLVDRFVFACMLQRDALRRGFVPHLVAYKNLQRIVNGRLQQEKLLSRGM